MCAAYTRNVAERKRGKNFTESELDEGRFGFYLAIMLINWYVK
jgi:hypothetical protein